MGEDSDSRDAFPIGMRVMVVDDDPFCLVILKKMLLQCKYHVTACSRAVEALELLREKSSKFDLVISDVYMPDIDGFKLLELIGLEMDLPVIMMSANGETNVVMKGITHGACDYLLKPVRMEELRNIWQHVVRKRGAREVVKEESSGEWDENEKFPEYSSKKRKEKMDSPPEDQIDDMSGLKKARVVWSGDLHRLFVKAVNQLGVEKAVPKRILDIMNVQGLTRENVASHLQKYRLGLKRLSGVDLEPHPIASFQADASGSFGGAMCVRPGGSSRSSSSSSLARTSSCGETSIFGRGINQLDPATLATLQQLQSMTTPAHDTSHAAQVLKGPRALKMRQTAFDRIQVQDGGAGRNATLGTRGQLLQRTASIELGCLKMQTEWAKAWQQHGLVPAVKEEKLSMGSSFDSTGEQMDLQDLASLAKTEGPTLPPQQHMNKISEEPPDLSDFGLVEGPDYYIPSSPPLPLQQQQQENWSIDF